MSRPDVARCGLCGDSGKDAGVGGAPAALAGLGTSRSIICCGTEMLTVSSIRGVETACSSAGNAPESSLRSSRTRLPRLAMEKLPPRGLDGNPYGEIGGSTGGTPSVTCTTDISFSFSFSLRLRRSRKKQKKQQQQQSNRAAPIRVHSHGLPPVSEASPSVTPPVPTGSTTSPVPVPSSNGRRGGAGGGGCGGGNEGGAR